MHIIGLGLDATEIDRVRDLMERFGPRFLNRIFTAHELDYCMAHRDPAPSLAARFAAKEAGMKALGTGRAFGVLWKDVEVFRRTGPPQLRLHGGAARRFTKMGGDRTLLTLTHARELALAHVMLLGDPARERN
ncbi:MAG: holo-ACP synthase [Vicinamibacterales bacterium]